MIKINNLVNFLDDRFGLIFFKNNNLFSYNVFHNLFKKRIINKKNDPDFLKDYTENGFLNGPKVSNNSINEIISEISLQKNISSDQSYHLFEWSKKMKIHLEKIIYSDIGNILLDLQKYYCSPLLLTHARVQRNFGFTKEDLVEKYSDNFHNDKWLFTYIKVFINLEDIDENSGPTHIIPLSKTKEFIKSTKYKSRNEYLNKDFKGIFVNTGKKSDSFVFCPSLCIHKAGIPKNNKKRDMLMLQFAATPNYKNQSLGNLNFELNEDVFLDHDKLSYKYAKPYGFRKTYKLLDNFINHS